MPSGAGPESSATPSAATPDGSTQRVRHLTSWRRRASATDNRRGTWPHAVDDADSRADAAHALVDQRLHGGRGPRCVDAYRHVPQSPATGSRSLSNSQPHVRQVVKRPEGIPRCFHRRWSKSRTENGPLTRRHQRDVVVCGGPAIAEVTAVITAVVGASARLPKVALATPLA
jgi:hypothetical protein